MKPSIEDRQTGICSPSPNWCSHQERTEGNLTEECEMCWNSRHLSGDGWMPAVAITSIFCTSRLAEFFWWCQRASIILCNLKLQHLSLSLSHFTWHWTCGILIISGQISAAGPLLRPTMPLRAGNREHTRVQRVRVTQLDVRTIFCLFFSSTLYNTPRNSSGKACARFYGQICLEKPLKYGQTQPWYFCTIFWPDGTTSFLYWVTLVPHAI